MNKLRKIKDRKDKRIRMQGTQESELISQRQNDTLPKDFIQTRYHSLVVKKDNLPENIIITSISNDDNEIMSLEIKDKQIYGVQLHPESIMSEHGYDIINNFLKI